MAPSDWVGKLTQDGSLSKRASSCPLVVRLDTCPHVRLIKFYSPAVAWVVIDHVLFIFS